MVTWQLQKGRYYGACSRSNATCKSVKMIREDAIENQIIQMLEKLVCPSPAIIAWVADTMRRGRKDDIQTQERLAASVQLQIDRIGRMDESLYDDKLSGEITQEKYNEKHQQFVKQKAELSEQFSKLDTSFEQRLDQKLVLLELSQKAVQIYRTRTPEQKRLIISKLFENLTLKEGALSVTYTNFAQAIAEKVQETRNIMGV